MKFTRDDFIKQFNLQKTISYEDFSNALSVLNGSDTSGTFAVRSDLETFVRRVSKKDNRLQRLDTYRRKLYQMIVVEPEKVLGEWFDRTAAITEDLNFYFEIPNTQILEGGNCAPQIWVSSPRMTSVCALASMHFKPGAM